MTGGEEIRPDAYRKLFGGRLLRACSHSLAALGHLSRNEAAFRQELAILLASFPAGWSLAAGPWEFLLLVGAVLLVLLVETLNTAIEATCNAVSREASADIKLAKDCGSLAVLIAILIAVAIWTVALLQKIAPTLG